MSYCEKCDAEYEQDEECMCRQYKRWCEEGQKIRVPLYWRQEYWWGLYINDPDDCEHISYKEYRSGRGKCWDCGQWFDPPDDDDDGTGHIEGGQWGLAFG
jgi:hypothetical protein